MLQEGTPGDHHIQVLGLAPNRQDCIRALPVPTLCHEFPTGKDQAGRQRTHTRNHNHNGCQYQRCAHEVATESIKAAGQRTHNHNTNGCSFKEQLCITQPALAASVYPAGWTDGYGQLTRAHTVSNGHSRGDQPHCTNMFATFPR
jgi:hypothetical protein